MSYTHFMKPCNIATKQIHCQSNDVWKCVSYLFCILSYQNYQPVSLHLHDKQNNKGKRKQRLACRHIPIQSCKKYTYQKHNETRTLPNESTLISCFKCFQFSWYTENNESNSNVSTQFRWKWFQGKIGWWIVFNICFYGHQFLKGTQFLTRKRS